jgi:hypothetical protein
MKGFHTTVALNSQKAHVLHLCVIRHRHHAPQWPNTIVMPTLSTKGNKNREIICQNKIMAPFCLDQMEGHQLTFAGLS